MWPHKSPQHATESHRAGPQGGLEDDDCRGLVVHIYIYHIYTYTSRHLPRAQLDTSGAKESQRPH
jgi:hypothetical protein